MEGFPYIFQFNDGKGIMTRISIVSRTFLYLSEILWLVKPFPTHQIQFKFKLFCHFFTAFLQASFGMFISLNNCMKKAQISDKFDGINNNSAKKHGKFLMQVPLEHYYYVPKNVTVTKYTKESQLLQYISHIRKLWFVVYSSSNFLKF